MNMDYDALEFEIPLKNTSWFRVVDTSLDSPEDISDNDSWEKLEGDKYLVNSYSCVILINKGV